MAIYEFKCAVCGHVSEVWCTWEQVQNTMVQCEKCDGHMDRIMSAPNFHLIGSDWYKPVAKEPANKPESSTPT